MTKKLLLNRQRWYGNRNSDIRNHGLLRPSGEIIDYRYIWFFKEFLRETDFSKQNKLVGISFWSLMK